jgi:hypothetical protein
MRRWVIALALGAALLLPVAQDAGADEAGEGSADETPAEEGGEEAEEPEAAAEAEEEEAEEEEEPGFLFTYFDSVRTRVLTGANGILTAPADPVMAAVDPPKALEKASYGRYPLGFGSGFLLMLYRTFSGAVDLGFAPIPAIPVVSPVPRYKLIPGFVHDDE